MIDNSQRIEELELKTRTYNCLKRAGIHTVGDLLKNKGNELMDLRQFGVTSLADVQNQLEVHGLGRI